MISRVVIVLGLAVTFSTVACTAANDGPAAQANRNTPASAATPSPLNSNTQLAVNGEAVEPRKVDANSVAATSDPVAPPLQGRLEKMRNADSGSGSMDASELASKNARPAPDNSTFTSYLTDAGYEIRTFKSNPVILKVEKKIENNGNQSLKVFLRNGNVVQLPGGAISALSTASAESIASAAGISPAPVKAPPAGSTGAKKSGN